VRDHSRFASPFKQFRGYAGRNNHRISMVFRAKIGAREGLSVHKEERYCYVRVCEVTREREERTSTGLMQELCVLAGGYDHLSRRRVCVRGLVQRTECTSVSILFCEAKYISCVWRRGSVYISVMTSWRSLCDDARMSFDSEPVLTI